LLLPTLLLTATSSAFAAQPGHSVVRRAELEAKLRGGISGMIDRSRVRAIFRKLPKMSEGNRAAAEATLARIRDTATLIGTKRGRIGVSVINVIGVSDAGRTTLTLRHVESPSRWEAVGSSIEAKEEMIRDSSQPDWYKRPTTPQWWRGGLT
jgi:hypothetical protein